MTVIRKNVASSREDAWIETMMRLASLQLLMSRPPARTRGLKRRCLLAHIISRWSRPPARTRGLKRERMFTIGVYSKSRPPARTRGLKLIGLIMTMIEKMSRPPARTRGLKPVLDDISSRTRRVASSREDAWIETTPGPF